MPGSLGGATVPRHGSERAARRLRFGSAARKRTPAEGHAEELFDGVAAGDARRKEPARLRNHQRTQREVRSDHRCRHGVSRAAPARARRLHLVLVESDRTRTAAPLVRADAATETRRCGAGAKRSNSTARTWRRSSRSTAPARSTPRADEKAPEPLSPPRFSFWAAAARVSSSRASCARRAACGCVSARRRFTSIPGPARSFARSRTCRRAIRANSTRSCSRTNTSIMPATSTP